MSIIYTVLSKAEVHRLSERDHSYFKRKLEEQGWFNQLMHRPVNWQLLNELQCLLDREPLPRRKIEHRNGKATVRKVSPEEMEKLWK